MHPEFPYVAFISAALVLVPLPWHWRAGNIATLSMVAWLFLTNTIYGVDAVIWAESYAVVVPVWCDITTKFLIGASMALPAACMCVCIHLERVASVRQVRTSKAEKRRRQVIEALLCFGLPMLWMAIHYTVQGHRFDIIEGYGCRPNTYISIPAIFLILVPPVILSVVTLVYACLALMHFMRRRITFAKHVESRSGMSTSRYLRLMLMAIVEIILGVGTTSLALASATLDVRPWTNWADVHWDFSRIGFFPAVLVPPILETYYYILWWIVPISSFLFFLFFAFGKDAMEEYGICITWLRRRIFHARIAPTYPATLSSVPSSLPSYHTSFATLPSSPSTASHTAPPSSIKDVDDDPFSRHGSEHVISLPLPDVKIVA